jgi:hypothetical protein
MRTTLQDECTSRAAADIRRVGRERFKDFKPLSQLILCLDHRMFKLAKIFVQILREEP